MSASDGKPPARPPSSGPPTVGMPAPQTAAPPATSSPASEQPASEQPASMHQVESYPPVDESRSLVQVPISKVTLLEDRAQVERRGKIKLVAGRNRLYIDNVAPVLQDVSLRAEAKGARVVDICARRAIRVQVEDKPSAIAALEAEIEALATSFGDASEDRGRAEERRQSVLEMIVRGVQEIPEDAGWGLVAHQTWHDTLEGLFKKSRELDDRALILHAKQTDLNEELQSKCTLRAQSDRPDAHFGCRLEIDLDSDGPAEVELQVDYVVPGALWRPLHRARLQRKAQGHRLVMHTQAAVWQNTGEDWDDVELWFSTARSSLGTEPPRLRDDLLSARRRSDEVVVQRREVSVDKASVGGEDGGGPPPSGIELPGVDDGGEIQNLKAQTRARVPSDGRPNLLPLSTTEAEAEVERFTAPELDNKVFVRVRAVHGGVRPLLAGPVELVRESGAVGWSKLLFVAPQERFEQSFGPDHELRLTRKVTAKNAVDHVDGWQHRSTFVQIFLSNLGQHEQTVEMVERIPVSEIEHVRVALLEEETTPMPEVDDDGMCTWRLTVPARGHHRVHLGFRVSTAPGVQPV